MSPMALVVAQDWNVAALVKVIVSQTAASPARALLAQRKTPREQKTAGCQNRLVWRNLENSELSVLGSSSAKFGLNFSLEEHQ
jgi:hypothetical protein